jgi:hypothetical protein
MGQGQPEFTEQSGHHLGYPLFKGSTVLEGEDMSIGLGSCLEQYHWTGI